MQHTFFEYAQSQKIGKLNKLVILEASPILHQIRSKSAEELKDSKGLIGIRKSKNKQHNDQAKKDKRTNNDLQNLHIKLKIE